MKPTIEHPKVFISYAWASPEYQETVTAFASDLRHDGIDVQYDKWGLKEGNDTYAFMEQCVNDKTVTNVLILLDPVYAQKADTRTGGVGTETQIISPEIYNNTKQDKFLPVIMQRNEDGSVPKPHYLQGRLHFDLTDPEHFDEEYARLVKRLYGVEIYIEPELGKMPAWVTDASRVSSSKRVAINSLRIQRSSIASRGYFASLLGDLRDRISTINFEPATNLDAYDSNIALRDEFLELLKVSPGIGGTAELFGDFFQETYDAIDLVENKTSIFVNSEYTLLHELFIYIVAFYVKTKDLTSLEYIINRTYFGKIIRSDIPDTGYGIFYEYNDGLEREKKIADNKNYHSGTAELWIENLSLSTCSRKEFVFADNLLCNYAYYGANYRYKWQWFPVTYVYDSEYDSTFSRWVRQLQSLEIAKQWCIVFGYKNINDFKSKIDDVKKVLPENSMTKRASYIDIFDPAPLIQDYIKTDQIGTLR